jgi:hypothetical protein
MMRVDVEEIKRQKLAVQYQLLINTRCYDYYQHKMNVACDFSSVHLCRIPNTEQ